MGKKPKLTKRNLKYKFGRLNPAQISRIRKIAMGRERIIFEKALENKSSAEIEEEKIILSEGNQNKNQPVSSKTIRCIIKKLSEKMGIKFTINDLNLYSQRKDISKNV